MINQNLASLCRLKHYKVGNNVLHSGSTFARNILNLRCLSPIFTRPILISQGFGHNSVDFCDTIGIMSMKAMKRIEGFYLESYCDDNNSLDNNPRSNHFVSKALCAFSASQSALGPWNLSPIVNQNAVMIPNNPTGITEL